MEGTRYAVDVERGGQPTTQSLTLTNAGDQQVKFLGGGPGMPGLILVGRACAPLERPLTRQTKTRDSTLLKPLDFLCGFAQNSPIGQAIPKGKTGSMMKRSHQLALAFAILAAGLFMGGKAAAAPSATASYSLNMVTFLPRANSNSGSSVAMVDHDDGRELLNGFKVWASLFVQTEIGAFHMNSNLTGNKGGSASCELNGSFSDTVTVNTKKGSSLLSGMVRLSGQVHGGTYGGGARHGGDISLKITVHNHGSAAHPKNTNTILTYYDGWGDSQIDLAPLVAQTVSVDKSDRLTITATQTIKAHAISEGGYVFDLANFHETSHFYIDSLAADLILTSDSGHNYSSPRNAAGHQTWALYE